MINNPLDCTTSTFLAIAVGIRVGGGEIVGPDLIGIEFDFGVPILDDGVLLGTNFLVGIGVIFCAGKVFCGVGADSIGVGERDFLRAAKSFIFCVLFSAVRVVAMPFTDICADNRGYESMRIVHEVKRINEREKKRTVANIRMWI